MKLGTQTGSLVNHIMSRHGNPTPEIGMGATICGWSDRHAATIIEISKSGKSLTAQYDTATRTDNNGMSDSQTYSYERNPNGSIRHFTLRQNGRWVAKGSGMGSGTYLSIGHRSEHYDFSF